MSLFDPNTTEEQVQLLANDGWWNGSGQPIPPLPDLETRHLEDELLKIGLKVIGSADRASGWEDAYAAFVNAFLRTGAPLMELLLHVDIPNMLFNFSLRNGWFPHLTLLKESEPGHLLAPKRIPITEFATTGPIFYDLRNKQQQLGWFKDRIRPAVLEWTVRASEQEMKYDAIREGTENRVPLAAHAGTDATRGARGEGHHTHWLRKELTARGWSTLTLYELRGPDRKTSEGYIKGKTIRPDTLKKIVTVLNSQVPPGCSPIDINNLPH